MLNFQQESLDLLGKNFNVVYLDSPVRGGCIDKHRIKAIFAPLGFYCGKERIDTFPNLKAIVSNTTGVPHIDVDYAESKGIKVISLKDEQEFLKTITSTAEHTWGLLLALIRNTPWAFDDVKRGKWNRRDWSGPSMLSRMSLGVIGYGRLGEMVLKYAYTFGMKCTFYDPPLWDHWVKTGEGGDKFFDEEGQAPYKGNLLTADSLKSLVATSDVVSLHVPHNSETEGMLNEEIFASFKPGSFFINTARGEIIDFDALLKELESGRIAGAALDVMEGEFESGFSGSDKLKKHPLLEYARKNKNLILTPHIGGSTIDAWENTERHTIEMLIDYLK